jgi:Cdc6-like AAA superfamily ATPase
MARAKEKPPAMNRNKEILGYQVGTVFTPAVPVSEEGLFAGRFDLIRRVIDVINQRGQHAVIFGERGVGKTSLANIISSKFRANRGRVFAPRINCDSTDNFTSLWRKMFGRLDLLEKKPAPGFNPNDSIYQEELFDATIVPDDVRKLLTRISQDNDLILILIFDEFDRLTDPQARRAVADTVKALSDYDVRVTMILVGVADTVDELIAEHQSIERALVQIQMTRMSVGELYEILDKGMGRLEMQITERAKSEISLLAHGLPHYAHLLGLHATRTAIDSDQLLVDTNHVKAAIARAVDDAQQSLRSDYMKAVTSPQTDNIYSQVLVACALTKADEYGYFAAAAVRDPLGKIRQKRCEIPSFAKHLKEFTNTNRGPILKRIGEKYKSRYRFINPLMQPLIIMKALFDGRISKEMLEEET